MPRTKGSKNKPKTEAPILTVEEIENKMAAVEAEIEDLSEKLKEKKTELKQLAKDKLAAEEAAIARKAEEDKAKLLDAVEKSGKSIEEILELLK